jgi:hypothetical protein
VILLPAIAVLLASAPALTARAAEPAPAVAAAAAANAVHPGGTGVVDLSLVEALSAIREPALSGLFSFINEDDAPFAFADLIARDKKARRRYLKKLGKDREAGGGLTRWDHQVCASLVNLYASPLADTFGRPDKKRMSLINECVLSPVVPLEKIVAGRRK